MNFTKIFQFCLTSFLVSGCVGSSDTLNESNSNAQIAMGESIAVVLDANKTTGYEWWIVSDGSPMLKLVKSEYKLNDAPKGMVGVGGVECFEFVGQQKGTAHIEFMYKRPWEKTGVKNQSFSVEVK